MIWFKLHTRGRILIMDLLELETGGGWTQQDKDDR